MTMPLWNHFIPVLNKEDERMNKYIDFNDAKISTFEYIERRYFVSLENLNKIIEICDEINSIIS